MLFINEKLQYIQMGKMQFDNALAKENVQALNSMEAVAKN